MLDLGKKSTFYLIIKLKDTMEWKKLKQQEDFFSDRTSIELDGEVYKEHLVLLCKTENYNTEPRELHQLRCWNMSIQ